MYILYIHIPWSHGQRKKDSCTLEVAPAAVSVPVIQHHCTKTDSWKAQQPIKSLTRVRPASTSKDITISEI